MADRLIVHALKLAAGYKYISIVPRVMEQMLNTPGELDNLRCQIGAVLHDQIVSITVACDWLVC